MNFNFSFISTSVTYWDNKELPKYWKNCAKNCCLCSFCSLDFVFVSWFWLDFFRIFYAQNLFLKKKKKKNWLEIVLIASFTLLLMYTPINPLIENLFVHTYFYLWSSVRISSFYENLFEPFLSVRISFSLWSSVRIYFRNSLWK